MSEHLNTIASVLAAAIEDHQSGWLEKAAEGYAEVLARSPGNSDALHLSGLISFQNGDLTAGKELIQKAISHDSSSALYHANLGRVEMALEHYGEAIDAWKRALAIAPASADIHSDLSGAYLKQSQAEQALHHSIEALRHAPQHPMALLNKGLAHADLNQIEPAIKALFASTHNFPEDADLWFQLGRLYQQSGDAKLTEHAYANAVKLAGGYFEASNNLGNFLRAQGRFQEAVEAYENALLTDTSQSDVHSNLGVAYQEMGKSEAALNNYRKAIDLNPDNAEARRNLGMGLLQMGDYTEGWAEYEWRWKTDHFKPIARSWTMPRWHGQDASDKSLLVHCEQGFGDCIQFIRYVSLAALKFKSVIIEAPSEMKDLFARLDGVSDVITLGDPLPACDYQIPLLSLAYVFQTRIETIPNQISYLQADRQKTQFWKERLNKQQGQCLVGIAWKGSHLHQRDRMRSPGLQAFTRLLTLAPHLRFISLQKDGAAGDGIEDYTSDLQSFDDTAALMSNLDRVVTPDTVIAHLAGALAIQTFVVLPVVSEWRWLQARDDSPWYPNTTLVRQRAAGDWESCIDVLAQKLQD